MDNILDFKKLPTMHGKASYCVDAAAWNSLIDYIQAQTLVLNELSNKHKTAITLLTNAMDALTKAQRSDREIVLKITQYLKEGV